MFLSKDVDCKYIKLPYYNALLFTKSLTLIKLDFPGLWLFLLKLIIVFMGDKNKENNWLLFHTAKGKLVPREVDWKVPCYYDIKNVFNAHRLIYSGLLLMA